MQYSTFRGLLDTAPTTQSAADLPGLLETLASSARPDHPRDAQPTWSPATFRGPRSAATVGSLGALVLDLDDVPDDHWTAVLRRLDGLGIAYAWHTSWRHKEESGLVRVRLIVPLSAAYDLTGRADYWSREVWPRLAAHVLGDVALADPQCADAGRQYFVPVPGRAGYWEDVVPGRPLDLAQLTSLPAPEARRAPTQATRALTLVDLRKRADSLRHAQTDRALAQDAVRCLRAVVRGEAWGVDGSREGALSSACFYIVQKWPGLDPEQTASLFEAACADIRTQPDAGAQRYTAAFVARKLREKLKAVAQAEPTEPTESSQPIARVPGVLLLTDRGCWVRQDSAYVQYSGQQLCLLPRVLADQGLAVVDGRGKPLSLATLKVQYGEHAQVEYAVGPVVGTTYVDGILTITTAPPPPLSTPPVRAELVPEFDARIARWLELLGGDRHPYLLDWIAWASLQDRECSMLWLTGASGCGKSLLVNGLAKLWGQPEATRLDAHLLQWSGPMAKCPILFADEKLPYDSDRRCTDLDGLKALVSGGEHELTYKGRDAGKLRAFVRVAVTANDARSLVTRLDRTADAALQAVTNRVLHIPIDGRRGTQVRAYLRDLLDSGQQWGDDAIAQHSLWLRDQRADRLPSGSVRLLSGLHQPELVQLLRGGGRPARRRDRGAAVRRVPHDGEALEPGIDSDEVRSFRDVN